MRLYVDSLIGFNEYLDFFPEAKLTDKIGVTEIDKGLLNSMPISWIKQAYVQGFDCEYIYFNKAVNIFQRMEITESIYKDLV